MDEVPELPVPIIHDIMSLLDYKEAARSMVLSKFWLHAWSTRPFLDFDESYFHFDRIPGTDASNRNDVLFRHVDQTMENYYYQRISIQKFRLHIQWVADEETFLPLLEKWLAILLQNDVLELDVKTIFIYFLLPPELFGSKSLQVLKLSFLSSQELVLTNTDIMCRNLKNLQLEKIQMDDDTFRILISCCSLIEELHLIDCRGFKVHIANLPYLRVLRLTYNGDHDVDIDAPMLQCLTYKAKVGINIGESGNLKSLSIRGSKIVDEQLQKILFMNPLLEDLSLHDCSELTQINFSGLSLECLKIQCRRIVKVINDAPNLHNWGETGLPITSPTPIHKLVLSVHSTGEIGDSWFHALRELLTISSKPYVEISSFFQINFNAVGFRIILLPDGHEIEMLRLNHSRVCLTHLFALLSTFRPKTFLYAYGDSDYDIGAVGYFLKKLKSRKIPKCCKGDRIKCWRHYIKDVKIYDAIDQEQNLLRLHEMFDVSATRSYWRMKTGFTFEWK